MPFIRQTRDKRGFEQTVVMHAYHPGGHGPARPRVIYLFRTPANLKVGRQALDPEVMEALEHTHPDLSFDWGSISREFVAPRPASTNDRPMRRPQQRPSERATSRPAPVPTQAAAPSAVPANDPSVLGRVLGAVEAARLRRRYSELVQRIARRGRTPEERDRLAERVRRLNPDDWADESAIRGALPTIDAAWDAISAELPSRRRGRRGGRRRPEDGRTPSAIMATGQQDGIEGTHDVPQDSQGVVAGAADPGGDIGDFGAESAPETGADPDLPVGH